MLSDLPKVTAIIQDRDRPLGRSELYPGDSMVLAALPRALW